MRELRALWLTSHYPNPVDPVTGIFFRTQARALARAKVSVHVQAPTPFAPPPLGRLSRKWHQYHATPRHLSDEGVDVTYPRYLAIPNQMRIGFADRLIARAVRASDRLPRFDLIHAHYAYPEGLAAVRLGRELDRPVVITLHGDDANTFPDLDRLARRRFTAAIKGADRVLAVSDLLVERTAELTGRRPEMAPIGIDLRPYDSMPSRTAARSTLGLLPHDFVVLYAGHLGERKGIAELAAAMNSPHLEDAVCVVVGDGPMWTHVAGRRNIRPMGRVPNELIPMYLAAADVLALPTYGEGTPTVIIEAGAARLPVVASAVGGIPALLAPDRGIMITPRSVGALVDGLMNVRSDRSRANQRAGALLEFVRRVFDVDRTARRLIATYEDVIATFRVQRAVS